MSPAHRWIWTHLSRSALKQALKMMDLRIEVAATIELTFAHISLTRERNVEITAPTKLLAVPTLCRHHRWLWIRGACGRVLGPCPRQLWSYGAHTAAPPAAAGREERPFSAASHLSFVRDRGGRVFVQIRRLPTRDWVHSPAHPRTLAIAHTVFGSRRGFYCPSTSYGVSRWRRRKKGA